jgi:hypothetical protein
VSSYDIGESAKRVRELASVPTVDQQRPTCSRPDDSPWLDGFVIAVVAGAAVVLGCQELFDADAWWHLRTGQWILSNRRVPNVDPFSFGSADRPWIDLSWLFQVLLAVCYRNGGAAGMILLAALACGSTLLIVLWATIRGSRSSIAALIWLPALLLMSTRFQPRPEVLSLIFTAAYLAILNGCDRRPARVWILPLLQVVWVNVHGLFILGPIILAAYVADGILRPLRIQAGGAGPAEPRARKWRRCVGLASLIVMAACLVNPYGWRGALFPFQLFPKITAWGGAYKENIGEFRDPRGYMGNNAISAATRNLFCRNEVCLFLIIPISFLVPCIWAAWNAAARRASSPQRIGWWLGGLAIVVSLVILTTLALPLEGTPVSLIKLGCWSPVAFAGLGLSAALALARRSLSAAALSACGGMALGGSIPWLETHWLVSGIVEAAGWGSRWRWILSAAAGPAALVSVILMLRTGGRVFRMLLTGAFGFLALQAVRNASVFALVAGFVIATNLDDWTERMRTGRTPSPIEIWVDRGARGVLVSLLLLGAGALALGWFSPARWGLFPLGLHERALTFAHDAAQFAGRPGMPRHAVVLDLAQAAVYLFHNSPERKPLIDPRLEIPAIQTFEAYVELDRSLNLGDAGWRPVIGRMGSPLILLDHAKCHGAEATLILDPGWRCVFFDAVASVFLPRSRTDLDRPYPTLDFAAQHFLVRNSAPSAGAGARARAEARGLFLMGWALLPRSEATWTHRIPVMLLAGDRARHALASLPTDAHAWLVLGDALWSQAPDLSHRPPTPADSWDPARALTVAQATFAYRRALALDPERPSVLGTLRRAYEFRGIADALEPSTALPAWRTVSDLSDLVEDLIRKGRISSVAALSREAKVRGIAVPWEVVDRIALVHLHLGEPEAARRLWKDARDCPSPGLRWTRLAEADLAALDYPAAGMMFQAALEADRRRGDAWFGLALLHLQKGDATDTLVACREGLTCWLTQPQRDILENMQTLAARFERP